MNQKLKTSIIGDNQISLALEAGVPFAVNIIEASDNKLYYISATPFGTTNGEVIISSDDQFTLPKLGDSSSTFTRTN
jgi:hypothetical protein